MSTYILWDIDGTLIYNTPTGGALYLDAIEHVTGVRPTVPVPDPHGMTEGQLLAAILDVNGLDGSRIGDVLYDLDVLSREASERGLVREPCIGADAAITAVAERGWTNALLTGNGPNRARYKLLAAGYDPEDFDWDHSYFGHESPTRHHLTAGARSALAEHTAVIIGDTPNDGLAAASASIPFVAIATGIYSAEQLRSTSAIVVAQNLEVGLADVLDAIQGTLPADPGPGPGAEAPTPDEAEPELGPQPEPDSAAVTGSEPGSELESEPEFEPDSEPELDPESVASSRREDAGLASAAEFAPVADLAPVADFSPAVDPSLVVDPTPVADFSPAVDPTPGFEDRPDEPSEAPPERPRPIEPAYDLSDFGENPDVETLTDSEASVDPEATDLADAETLAEVATESKSAP